MDDLINIVKNTKQGGKAIGQELKEQDVIINVSYMGMCSNWMREWMRMLIIWGGLGGICLNYWRKVVICAWLLLLSWRLWLFSVLSSCGSDPK